MILPMYGGLTCHLSTYNGIRLHFFVTHNFLTCVHCPPLCATVLFKPLLWFIVHHHDHNAHEENQIPSPSRR